MKMQRYLLYGLLLCSSTVFAADWVYLEQERKLDYYFDRDSIQPVDHSAYPETTQVLFKAVLYDDEPGAEMVAGDYVLAQFYLQCDQQRVGTASYASYHDDQVIHHAYQTEEPTMFELPTHSYIDRLYLEVCQPADIEQPQQDSRLKFG